MVSFFSSFLFSSNSFSFWIDITDIDTYRIMTEILSFNVSLDIKSFLDWLYEIKQLFDIRKICKDKKVLIVAYKLRGGTGAW